MKNQKNDVASAFPKPAYNPPPTLISKVQRERIDDVINNVSNAFTNDRIVDDATSEIAELYEFKLKVYEQNEADFQQRLQVASHEITSLSRRISFLKCEVHKHQSMHFTLQLSNKK
jgi:predicted nucleic-acid-binding protein